MTKQQQEAYNKFIKALDLQEQGISRQEIYHMVGYASLDSLTKAFKKQGYKYCDEKQRYIQVSNTESNTSCTTQTTEIVEVDRNDVVDPKQLEFVKVLEQEQETLVSMIEWFKQYSNTNNTSNTLIRIELPQSENVMISTRSNKVVWEQFKIFAKNNSANFKMGDLVAQALLDYMNKYE